jgi:hypothetical protein
MTFRVLVFHSAISLSTTFPDGVFLKSLSARVIALKPATSGPDKMIIPLTAG